MRPPRAPEQRAAWIAQWEADERGAAAHTAFLQSAHYDTWKEVFLQALVMDGKFDRQIRALKPHQALSDYWRKILARPAMGPEMAFPRGLSENIANVGALAIMASRDLACHRLCAARPDSLGAHFHPSPHAIAADPLR
jgi:hypothetical protein